MANPDTADAPERERIARVDGRRVRCKFRVGPADVPGVDRLLGFVSNLEPRRHVDDAWTRSFAADETRRDGLGIETRRGADREYPIARRWIGIAIRRRRDRLSPSRFDFSPNGEVRFPDPCRDPQHRF